MKNLAYKPVLANFCEVDGVRDFTAHDMEFNEDGSINYIEKQVGCFTADKPYFEDDPQNDERKYICAKVAIPREYTDAADIIERKGGTRVSIELQINEMSYDNKDKLLVLNSVNVTGLTLLGVDPNTGNEVLEGMQGARLDIQDFSAENNSVINKSELINEITTAVLEQLSDKKAFAENLKEGGKQEMGKFNELLEKYGKTAEEVTFDYENMTDEELEAAFANAFQISESSSEEDNSEDEEEKPVVTENESEDTTEDISETSEEEETPEKTEEFDEEDESEDDESEDNESDEEHQTVSAIEDEDSTETRQTNSVEYSVTYAGQTRTNFATLNEQLEALWTLVNDTYGEADNEWYSVDADPEKKIVYMHGWTNHYRQSYKVKGDVFSLTGDRTRVYAVWASEDEKKELERIKGNYSALESELNEYKSKELHSAREEVLASEDYSVMADFTEFNELKEHMDDYSIEELTDKADLVYAKFMKSNYSTFSANNESGKHMVFMTSGENKEEERLPYGGLFKNFKGSKR